jgi:hypothetical protein
LSGYSALTREAEDGKPVKSTPLTKMGVFTPTTTKKDKQPTHLRSFREGDILYSDITKQHLCNSHLL